jgi:hypothetical protein
MTRQLERDEACEFCYAPAFAVCVYCWTAICENCSETRIEQMVGNDYIEEEEPEFDDGGEGQAFSSVGSLLTDIGPLHAATVTTFSAVAPDWQMPL